MSTPSSAASSDVLILGSGLAGLVCALHLADRRRVTIVTKGALLEGSSAWAQGGIAAAMAREDSVGAHIDDTRVAGAGLCRPEVVERIATRAPAVIRWLQTQGVVFTAEPGRDGALHLGREGGHSARRIVHVADSTGRAVQETLEQRILRHPNITVLEQRVAIDLVCSGARGGERRVHGAYVLDRRSGEVETLDASSVILATGGLGKVYLYTTNPDVSTGDGVAIAWRAGCRVANLEFIQFHPTCLYHAEAKSFLISEALRGEGGRLVLADGTRFMPAHDARAELAPRDIVARAIDFEMKTRGLDCVWLDMTHHSREFIEEHFPTIDARCRELGIDMARRPIPVVPAAHYSCGGVVTDAQARTDIGGLYAVGEVACTGLHGANRLASNSLLECLVMGEAAAADILASDPPPRPALPAWDHSRVTPARESVLVAHDWDAIRRLMWDLVGIVRSDERLALAARRLEALHAEIASYYARHRIDNDLLELRNVAEVARLIVRGAQQRRESRGLHYNRDVPETLAEAVDTVLTP
ncbi:MAG: L-aspartate oxidase [Rhodocyclaceae bacterium]|nr:L-aspartate oxidase [Rhodocyclaceae bacterium]